MYILLEARFKYSLIHDLKKLVKELWDQLKLFRCGVPQTRFKTNADRENFFRIGAKAGVNINKINGESYKDGFNYNYLLGGFMQFNFSGTFGFQPEVNFVQSSSEFSTSASNVYDNIFRGGSQRKAKLGYLKIPLLFKY